MKTKKIKYEIKDGDKWFTPKTGVPQPGGQLYYALDYCNIGLAKRGQWRVKQEVDGKHL